MATITHSVVSAAPNDPTKEVSSNAWNAPHVITGLVLTDIADATAMGRAVLQSVDQADARAILGVGGSTFDGAYASLTGIPATFAPTAHTHPSTDVSDSTAVGRSVLTAADAAAARTAIGAGTSSFGGAYGSLSGIPSTFTPAAHVHSGADITSGTVAVARLGSGTPNATNYLRGDGTWAAPAGGSDPWTYIKLGADFSTGSATAVDVTGLGFTPAANTSYEFEARILLRTATTTVNPRTGLAWPTGMTDGMAQIMESQAANTAPLFASGNPNAALLIAVGGLPNTTQSWPATVRGMVIAGASPSGNVRIQLASETAATNVTVKAGSFIKYRVI